MIINKEGLTIGKNYIIACKRNGNTKVGAARYNINIYDATSGRPECYSLNSKGVINRTLLKDNTFNVVSSHIEDYINALMEVLDNANI